MLDTTRGESDILSLFEPPGKDMPQSERARIRPAIRILRNVRDTLIENGSESNPTIASLFEYQIVHVSCSWRLHHTKIEACHVFDGVGEGSLRLIQEALLASVGAKLTVVDKRPEQSREKKKLPL